MTLTRYAVYFVPAPGAFADFGAAWLGWDAVRGCVPTPPEVAHLNEQRNEITQTPRKYGLHATLKPPFRLADGQDEEGLANAVERLAGNLKPVAIDGLTLAQLGRFLALVPQGDTSALNALAAETVRALDAFRAPLSEAELSKRRAGRLSPTQDALLLEWGYPHVMDAFRFHITLTGKMSKAKAKEVHDQLAPVVEALLPRPFTIDALSLVGEGPDGFFRVLNRFQLTG